MPACSFLQLCETLLILWQHRTRLAFRPQWYRRLCESRNHEREANAMTALAGVRFQVCRPTPMASGYMYVSPAALAA
jgi:hypothetical protein